MTIDLQALSGRIKAEEAACDLLRASIAEPGANASSLQLALACKEKWLRESRVLYAQEWQKRRKPFEFAESYTLAPRRG